MSTTTNVEFYEKVKVLQERQHDNESRRLGLEQQLNTYMQSDHRLARLKAVRLQNYWKKICEDEKKSQWRNEQLLRDFDRVESHMATLNTRTERLRVMKNQYEDYIEKTYPNWKEKILHNQRLQHQVERQQQLRAEAEAQAQAAAAAGATSASNIPVHGYVSMPEQVGAYRISSTLPPQHEAHPYATDSESYRVAGQTAPFSAYSGLNVSGQGHAVYSGQNVSGQGQGHAVYSGQNVSNQGQGHAVYSGQNVSNQGQGHAVYSGQNVGDQGHAVLSPGEIGQVRQPSQAAVLKPHVYESAPNNGYIAEPVRTQAPMSVHVSSNVVMNNVEASHPQEGGDNNNGNEADVSSVEEEPVVAMTSPRRQSGYGDWKNTQQKTDSFVPPSAEAVKPRTDDTDDFESDISLPMSGADASRPEAAIEQEPEEPQAPPVSVPFQSSADRAQTPDSLYTHPDITLDGLYNLMSAVEELLPASRQPKDLYRTETPRQSVKSEILQNASKGAILSHIDGGSISMVILEQLPLLVMSCEESCLLPDPILFKPSSQPTQSSVRANIHPASQSFWDRLCEHFLYLIKYESMVPDDIGELFGPLLISEDSPYETKAKILVSKVMESADPDVIKSPASTSTFSTLSPRKPPEADNRGQQQTETAPSKTPEPVNNMVEESGDDEDDFFEKPVPREITATPLTQSAAYRQLLGDTVSTTQKSMSYVESDDSDDVEHQLVGSVKAKTETSPHRKPDPVKVDTSLRDDAGPLSPARLSRVSSPDLGSTGGGYVPSGLDKSATSSLGSSGRKKGPAFKFQDESDTDEDIDILATGTTDQKTSQQPQQDDDADFDFYG